MRHITSGRPKSAPRIPSQPRPAVIRRRGTQSPALARVLHLGYLPAMPRLDPHSYADSDQPSIKTIALALTVDFERQVLHGSARFELDGDGQGPLDLDTRDLEISAVTHANGTPLEYVVHPAEGFMGSRLTISGPGPAFSIHYETGPEASALQWLEPAQTDGGALPYMFTQCQAIHARSVMPCQDTPRVRQQLKVELQIPNNLNAVMAAADEGRTEAGDHAVHEFFMPQAIPSYLLAFAVGDLSSRDVGPRTKVWAEPGVLDAAAWEFDGVDAMLSAAEDLFGEYPWQRFDLLVMPPSFPYGGMENPRLTFLTPTLLAKDRSLVNVVAHELAHSWTGNLVTNASMNDFWLNEGFTVYAERRILEVLEGKKTCALHTALGKKALDADIARLAAQDPQLTRLENDLSGLDPDDVYSSVPYEKGFLFVTRLEAAVGRTGFDAFLAKYIKHFAFTSITTDDFVGFLKSNLPEAVEKVDIENWLHGTGIPDDAPTVQSDQLVAINRLAEQLGSATAPTEAELKALSVEEWQVLLSVVPEQLPVETCRWLDKTFALSTKTNYEILVSWLTVAIRSGLTEAWPVAKQTLLTVGRGKYLRPLYTALISQGDEGRAYAKAVFGEAKAGYHPVAQQLVTSLL